MGSAAGAPQTPAGPSAPIEQRPKDMGPRDGAGVQRQCRSPGKRLWRAEHAGSVGALMGADAALHPACSTGCAGSSFLVTCGVCPEPPLLRKCLIHYDTSARSPSCQWELELCFHWRRLGDACFDLKGCAELVDRCHQTLASVKSGGPATCWGSVASFWASESCS